MGNVNRLNLTKIKSLIDKYYQYDRLIMLQSYCIDYGYLRTTSTYGDVIDNILLRHQALYRSELSEKINLFGDKNQINISDADKYSHAIEMFKPLCKDIEYSSNSFVIDYVHPTYEVGFSEIIIDFKNEIELLCKKHLSNLSKELLSHIETIGNELKEIEFKISI